MSSSKMSFAKWILLFLSTYAIFDIIFVGLAGLALSLSPRNLIEPLSLIFLCGVIASVLIYWTRESYYQPKSCARRLALTFFVYLVLFMSTLIFSAVRNGLVSKASFLSGFVYLVCPGATIAAIFVYFAALNKL